MTPNDEEVASFCLVEQEQAQEEDAETRAEMYLSSPRPRLRDMMLDCRPFKNRPLVTAVCDEGYDSGGPDDEMAVAGHSYSMFSKVMDKGVEVAIPCAEQKQNQSQEEEQEWEEGLEEEKKGALTTPVDKLDDTNDGSFISGRASAVSSPTAMVCESDEFTDHQKLYLRKRFELDPETPVASIWEVTKHPTRTAVQQLGWSVRLTVEFVFPELILRNL